MKTVENAARSPVPARFARQGRDGLFLAVLVVAVINGFASRAVSAVMLKGWSKAFWTLFDTSAIIWLSAWFGLMLFSKSSNPRPAGRIDTAVAAVCTGLALLPVNHASWIGLILAASWLLATSDPQSPAGRGAKILLAMTVPLFWARLTFSFAGDLVLRADAFTTGLLLGTASQGNVVQFANRSGFFQIYPACSSLVNMSLALLAWWTAANVFPGIGRLRLAGFALVMAALVFAINITRLVAIGTYPEHFELIHGDIGNTVTGWVTLVMVALVCRLGVGPALTGRGPAERAASAAGEGEAR